MKSFYLLLIFLLFLHYYEQALMTINQTRLTSLPSPEGLRVCLDQEWACYSGECISKEYVCDDDYDCSDKSDERKCGTKCEPNEHKCSNGKCIRLIWRCDGFQDCSDGSDEYQCEQNSNNMICRYDEYMCSDNSQCIPKDFLCDLTPDCKDFSDEIGCSAPTIVQSLPETMIVVEGGNISLTCRAIGKPTPIIYWTFNKDEIPADPRIVTTSVDGKGTLSITNIQASENGTWGCEAINVKDSVESSNTCQIWIKPVNKVCSASYFNDDAQVVSHCLRCFCFDITNDCHSSFMSMISISLVNKIEVVVVKDNQDELFSKMDSFQIVNQKSLTSSLFLNQFKLTNLSVSSNLSYHTYFYWSLPQLFLGNQLNSYGGYLKFNFRYHTSQPNKHLNLYDVIISGNGITLYHVIKNGHQSNIDNTAEVRFWKNEWTKNEHSLKINRSKNEIATRRDIMQVLANLQFIYIRASFDDHLYESNIINVRLETAISQDLSEGKPAIFVEKCNCPVGHLGNSCEKCAPGYSRSNNDPFTKCTKLTLPCSCHNHSNKCDQTTGQCISCLHNTDGFNCERCIRGYYGNATNGTPNDCQPCPCPYIAPSIQLSNLWSAGFPAQWFSPTCSLDADNDITCNTCPIGFEGRRCEKCAPGYFGDPTLKDGKCVLKEVYELECNSIGSLVKYSKELTGKCQCKPLVTGLKCDQCKVNSFYLNNESPDGCIDCFCMGITKSCTSSSLFKDSLVFKLDQTSPQSQISLIDLNISVNLDLKIIQVKGIDHLTFENTLNNQLGIYYWSLPSMFLGDKLTLYGQYLNYTLVYRQNEFGNLNSEPDVQMRGNGLTLIYYYSNKLLPDFLNTISITFFENHWSRNDNRPLKREEFMLVLSNIDYIIIKAIHSSEIISTSIGQISMNIASETLEESDFGDDNEALTVEQCHCPMGYRGLSCQNCDTGFTRLAGPYQLAKCVPCSCNGHSSDCDSNTGVCKNCLHNTTGDHCEKCAPSFSGDATQGSPQDCRPVAQSLPCQCDLRGSLTKECDIDQRCICKTYVEGRNCDQCKSGYYNLDESNEAGCSPCYCFEVVDQCHSSSYYLHQLEIDLKSNFEHNFHLTTRYNQERYYDEIVTLSDLNGVEFSYTNFSHLNETLYWALPVMFLGNKLTSYGGILKYTQYFNSEMDSVSFTDVDIELIGQTLKVFHINNPTLSVNNLQTFEIIMNEKNWQVLDQDEPRVAKREELLQVLVQIEAILIRASFSSNMKETLLKDVSLTIAVPEKTSSNIAVNVEQCLCPKGYFGLSCEQCAYGYIKETNASSPLKCVFCECNSHSETCDTKTGQCLECRHNTIGYHCEHCAEGYFGNAKQGSPDSCKPCPCPLTFASNSFSKTCYQDTDHQATCDDCLPGYVGRNCERCASGYFGDPLKLGSKCLPLGKASSSISVKIEEPKVRKVSTGSSISLRCTGHSLYANTTFNFVWTKKNGSLPNHATEASGLLSLSKVTTEDGGTYICTGSDLQSVAQDKVVIIVTSFQDHNKMKIYIEPTQQTVRVGSKVEFICKVEGYIRPNIYWQKGEQILNLSNHVLKIENVSKADEAEYYCIATDLTESSLARAYLFVIADNKFAPTPQVSISPANYVAHKGEQVKFFCKIHDKPFSKIKWTFENQTLPENAFQKESTLIISSVTDHHQGEYICTVSNVYGSHSARALLTLKKSLLEVKIEPHRLVISRGRNAKFRCIVKGNQNSWVAWIRIHRNLTERHKLERNTLVIEEAEKSDEGIYLCRAQYSGGFVQALAILMIQKIEEPLIELMPASSQLVSLGESAHFECHILSGIPKPTVEWSRVDGSRLSDQVTIVNQTVLKFHRASYRDDGDYICNATNTFGTSLSTASLHVQNGVRVNILQKNPYKVRQGNKVILDCVAEGRVHLSMEWRKEQNYFSETNVFQQDGTFRLIIDEVSIADSGFYICTASSGSERFKKSIQLIVESVHHPEPKVKSENKLIVAQINTTVELRCFALTDDVKAKISWRRDNVDLDFRFKNENGILRIQKVQINDTGLYSCLGFFGNNKVFIDHTKLAVVGTWAKAPPKVRVMPLIQYAKPGDSVYFDCLVEGEEPIIVDWNKVDVDQSNEEFKPKLYLKQIDYKDGGKYRCIAMNAAGKTEAISELIVANNFSSQDTFKRKINVFSDSNIEVECPTVFNFANNILWSFENHALPDNVIVSNNQLWVRNAKRNNAGRYICTISSNYGLIAQESVQISVKDHPSIQMQIIANQSNLTLGNQLQLKCIVFGEQNPFITWSKLGNLPFLDNVKINQNVLTIDNIRVENGGLYRCSTLTFSGSINRDYALYIYAHQQRVKQGSNAILHCPAESENIKWILKDKFSSRIQIKQLVVSIQSVKQEDAGLYICRVTTNGFVTEYLIALIVEAFVAQFDQNPISYITLPTLSDGYLKFSIEITFKPHQTDDGLILYSGQLTKKSDFISLGFTNHYLIFKFELGSGIVTIKSREMISANTWHSVRIVREMKEAVLFVDFQESVKGYSKGKFVGLDLLQSIYFGAIPDFNLTPSYIPHRKGFSGCISSIKLQEVEQHLSSQNQNHGVTKCNTCSTNVCLNGGTCQESGSPKGWCICSPGFSGSRCQRLGESCFPGICGEGRCIQKYDEKVECSCPIGSFDTFCEKKIKIQRPYFDGSSFAAYSIPLASMTNFAIKIQIKAKSLRNSFIMFTGQLSYKNVDFMALVLKNKTIEFILDTGSGTSFIRSEIALPINEWNVIKAERKFNQGTLSIGRYTFKGSSPGQTKGINLRLPLYIGGINFHSFSLLPKLGIDRGFKGCIKELEINGHKVNLVEDAIEASNINDCEMVHF